MCRSQQVVDFISVRLDEGKSCETIAGELLDSCIATDPRENRGIGCDNMTCCIIKFKDKFFLDE